MRSLKSGQGSRMQASAQRDEQSATASAGTKAHQRAAGSRALPSARPLPEAAGQTSDTHGIASSTPLHMTSGTRPPIRHGSVNAGAQSPPSSDSSLCGRNSDTRGRVRKTASPRDGNHHTVAPKTK